MHLAQNGHGMLLSAKTTAGTATLAGSLAEVGNHLWVPFAIVALTFAGASAKQLLTRAEDHRP
jgi:hypothetical protein